MKWVNTKIVVDIATDAVLSREGFWYHGPLAQAFSFGGNKSKQRTEQQQTSESGTNFNQDFLDQAMRYFGRGKKSVTTGPGEFDTERYLRENPDVAANKQFSADPYEHYLRHGQAEGRRYPGDPGGTTELDIPSYDPKYVRGAYTGASYTPVDGGDFDKIESNIFEGNKSKLRQAYDTSVARQREELSQAGALNSPSQYLEGSARSSLDRGFIENLQQAARDASSTTLGLKQAEATRRTGFDVDQGKLRTAFDTGEAERETGFNEQTAARLLELWLKKLQVAIESGRFATGQGSSSGSTDSMGGNFGIFSLGGSSS